MRLRNLILGAACMAALSTPALAQSLTAITGGRVLTGTSVIENGTVVIQNGRVVSVGTGAAPSGARVIDATGKVVTPGFVAVDSGLGGVEISSVGGSEDLRNGANTISASFDVSYGLDPWSITLPVARLGGITRAVVVPNHPGGGGGGHTHDDSNFAGVGAAGLQSPSLFAGQAAVIHLAAGTDILVKARVAM
ncbi:MAG: imidazolonepropionase, partial [Brevundimonas sp.]|nr:imidazolonepropionase [Brevundimonas sp.]